MIAARHALVSPSLFRASEKADHASAADLPKLTGRELEILRLSATGEKSQAIADTLFISKRTVDFHFANLFRKWGVKSRIQALKIARTNGLLSAPQHA